MFRLVVFLLLLLVLIVFGWSFAAANADKVQFSYFVGTMEQPLSLLLVLALFAGSALGVLASFFVVLRLKTQIRLLRKSEALARQAEQESNSFRHDHGMGAFNFKEELHGSHKEYPVIFKRACNGGLRNGSSPITCPP